MPLVKTRLLIKLLLTASLGQITAAAAITSGVTGTYHLPTPPAYRAKNDASLPHYYPQPYLGGYHAFGTPYRSDYFYRYYGPKFALGRWI